MPKIFGFAKLHLCCNLSLQYFDSDKRFDVGVLGWSEAKRAVAYPFLLECAVDVCCYNVYFKTISHPDLSVSKCSLTVGTGTNGEANKCAQRKVLTCVSRENVIIS